MATANKPCFRALKPSLSHYTPRQNNKCRTPFIPIALNEEVYVIRSWLRQLLRFIFRDPGPVNQCKMVQNGVVLHDLGAFPRFCPSRLTAFFSSSLIFFSGQINQSQSLFTYAQNETASTFAIPDFLPMFGDNITWQNDTIRKQAEEACGSDNECLFDVASTNDLTVGQATKDIGTKLTKESKTLGMTFL